MPTRILFWNIRDFSINKIADSSFKRQKGTTINRNTASIQRRNQIVSIINAVNPQIFILVELETSYTGRGGLVSTNGVNASIALLTAIRQGTGNDDWALIPPIITGVNEGVAVFYRSTNRYFTGPNIWSGGIDGISSLSHTVFPGSYPINLKNSLPSPGRSIPPGTQYNSGLPETLAAARVEFTVALTGNRKDFGDFRTPYMTTFSEVGGDGNVTRNLTLFSNHAPADRELAIEYLETLALLAETTSLLAPNEVRVIAGDFNLNVMDTTGDMKLKDAYKDLIARGYNLTIYPTDNVPDPLNGYIGYFATHIKPPGDGLYNTTLGETQYYPGYGYMGATTGNYIAIDNIYVKYGAAIAPGLMPKSTIMNTVVGSPFNLYALPNPTTPTGNIALANYMGDYYGGNPLQPAPSLNKGLRNRYKGWNYYGRIYSVSDHFALAIDV